MKSLIRLLVVSLMLCSVFVAGVSADEVSRSFMVDKTYLAIPLAEDEDKVQGTEVVVAIDGKNLFVEEMHFTRLGRQWWSNLDVSEFKGKNLTLSGGICEDAPPYSVGRWGCICFCR